MSSRNKHIIIIGNGIAGITAARHIRKLSSHTITVISGESEYFFARTALMYVYMGHMRWKDIMPYENWFWGKNKINLVKDYVTKIDHPQKSIITASGKHHSYDQLIIATGSSPNTLDIEGADLDGVTGLYSLQHLEYIDSKSKQVQKAVILGGGLIGIELAEMFHSRNIAVTHLVREQGYAASFLPNEESEIINHHISDHGIDLRLQTETSKVNGDKNGNVRSITTTTGEEIECQFVGVTIGVHPNVNWLAKSEININKGILVDSFLKTNLPDIFAIGDCAELRHPDPDRRAIEPVWYTGRMMGEAVAKTICGHETRYQPGIWFNSAKFFHIEYQTYGDVRPALANGQKSLYWAHEDGTKSIRINYTLKGVIGFNVLGIRLRQEVCQQWIQMSSRIQEVLADLELAVFDPEFSKGYSDHVREAYVMQTGETVLKKGNSNHNRVYSFLKKTKNLSV